MWIIKKTKTTKFLFIFILIIAWVFSGWPQIWQNPPFPPETKKVNAADVANMEWGVETSIDTTWTSVSFTNTFTDPIVVASGLYNYTSTSVTGECSVEAEIKSITTTSFQVRMIVPEHDQSGTCTSNPASIDVHWLAVEDTGTSVDTTIPGTSIKIQAGSFTDTDIDSDSSWTTDGNVTIYPTFTNPVVLHSRVSHNDSQFATSWVCETNDRDDYIKSSASSIHIHFNAAEVTVSDFSPDPETMHYVIFDTDADANVTGTVSGDNGSFFQILRSSDSVRGLQNTANGYSMGTLDGSFSSPSVAVGAQQEMDGSDGGWFFAKSISSSAWMVWSLEDQDESSNSERSHTTETMGGIIFEDAGYYPTSVSTTLTAIVSTDTFPTVTPGGLTVFATSTIDVNTNSSSGWNITLYGNDQGSSNTVMDNNTDTLVGITDQLEWVAGSATTSVGNAVRISSLDNSNDVLAFRVMTASGTASFLAPTWWGSADSYTDNANTLWAGIASSTDVTQIGNSSISSGGGSALNSVLYYLKVPTTQQSGDYAGNLTFTTIVNP